MSKLMIPEDVISAAKYYMGVPDGKFFKASEFDESVVNAKKAYITLNTLLGGETAEIDRFNEGKKQTPAILTPDGVRKMIKLFITLYSFAQKRTVAEKFETVRACRRSELQEGESTVSALTSTTKLTVPEIMELGYGNKNGLAICRYKIHAGAVVFDMEWLGNDYMKPEEREVLLLSGNKLLTNYRGEVSEYRGKDCKAAHIYEVAVHPPNFGEIAKTKEQLESVAYDAGTLSEIRHFFIELNTAENFPVMPLSYRKWKEYFKELVWYELERCT